MNCNYCEWRCDLTKGKGVCGMYELRGGDIVEKHPNKWSRCHGVYIERIPIFHAWPNKRFLQLGCFSCNAACAYCINASIAIGPQEPITFTMTPEEIVDLALKSNYKGIHFGINEVTVNLPSALAVSKAAKKQGLIVGCSTNAFFTQEVAKLFSDIFDFFNISLKSISDEFYKINLGLPSAVPVMRNIKYISSHAHVEITTPVVLHGNESELPQIADLLHSINPEMAWHIFRILPKHLMANDSPPDVEYLSAMVEKVKEKMPYTYFGNFIGSNWVDTICPNCGEIAIERMCDCACGAKFLKNNTLNGNCSNCGNKLPIIDDWGNDLC
ncbi:MAG: radical SAM protein [Lutispora sp.]|nr:radical SAM protein [Lutispora sp.]